MSDRINTHKPDQVPEPTQSQLDEIKAVLAEQSEWLLEQRRWQQEQELLQKELLELYKTVKGFLTVLGWLERMAIFIGKMSIAGGLVWAAFKIAVREGMHK